MIQRAALSALAVAFVSAASAQVDLEKGFVAPPASARAHTWWHWMNGNITKEGITADLEAMKQIGLGGAQIFNVSEGIPKGPVLIMSPEWRELVKFAAKEADRLGIELCMHNCPGWSSSGGPWITPENAMQSVVVSETRATGPTKFEAELKQPEAKAGYYRDIAVLAFPTPKDDKARIKDIRPKAGYEERYGQFPSSDVMPAEAVIAREGVVDLTAKMSGGKLAWEVPAGDWTILRFGHTPTGAMNAPSPDSGRGLEVDKFSRAAFDTHWAGMMGPVIKDLGPLAGKTLNNCLVDSYEMGHQNWTPKFREEFKTRRGYDPLTYMPVMTGRVVGSSEVSERFLWDYRRTIADLFADNYYTYFAQKCHDAGMEASIEPYDGPFECLLSGRDADIPMGEFWIGGGETASVRLAASVAHTYGRKLVGAESFTATPDVGRWQNHPYSLKPLGDLIYCSGINRFIIHRYAHQPWLDKAPGMTMGQWGTHFERTVTWWKQGAGWVEYLARCQSLLQQGLFAADVCYLASEAAPNNAPHKPELKAKGYDYDACNADVVLRRMTVKDGRLVLPDGMSYRVLVLPETEYMSPKLLARVSELVKQGATIIGARPTKSPTLTDLGDGDRKVVEMAGEVWGDCDGKTVKEHAFGKGRVVCGKAPEEVLASAGVGPDCSFGSGAPKMAWIHRTMDGSEVYFVSNQKGRAQEVECSFRVSGKKPEIWRAETGEIAPAPVWLEKDGRTIVTLRFEPAGSVFVVFRKPAGESDHLVAVKVPMTAEEAAPKIEIRRAAYEAKDGAGGTDVTEKIRAMVAAGETSIPANNGTYGDPAYLHVKRLRVEYAINGAMVTRDVEENATLELVADARPAGAASWVISAGKGGLAELVSFEAGNFQLQTAKGKTSRVEVKGVPAAAEISGAWTVKFPPKLGAPASVTLDKLASWTEQKDLGVKYFSGTAEYEKEFEVSAEMIGNGRPLRLELGDVKCFAQVTLNGKDLGVLWKPPFAVDVTGAVKPGKNTLKVQVTNLWVNRLIGDEQLPEDCEWNGVVLKQWPKWMVDGTARTSGRIGFTTWHHFAKDSALMESGLIGPVVLRAGERVKVE